MQTGANNKNANPKRIAKQPRARSLEQEPNQKQAGGKAQLKKKPNKDLASLQDVDQAKTVRAPEVDQAKKVDAPEVENSAGGTTMDLLPPMQTGAKNQIANPKRIAKQPRARSLEQ